MKSKDTDTRAHILNTGRSLTALRGYTGVGLSEILKEAGVPKGSFYHYFASKEAYGCALLETFVQEYGTKLANTLYRPDGTGRERLISYFASWQSKQLSDDPEDRCLVVKLSAEVADLSDDMSEILSNGVKQVLIALAETLEQGIADGSIAPMDNTEKTVETVYYLWLGASLVAALSRNDSSLVSAMHSTESLIPAP